MSPLDETAKGWPGGQLLARSARGDGQHFVLKLRRQNGEFVVLKHFGRKRSLLRDTLRDWGQRLLVGKTGMHPDRRARTERDTLTTWRREGFDVPRLVGADESQRVIASQPSVVMEFVDGRRFDSFIADPAVALEEKERLLTRLARDWSRRHARALELNEPLLIQVHASLDHVLYVSPPTERLVTFDFEVAWSRRHPIARIAAFEFARELASLRRCAPASQCAALEAVVARAYDAPTRKAVVTASGASGASGAAKA